MPGIRINTPVGANWEYSLDQQNWQTSPVFNLAPGSAPFVLNQEYPVYCRNTEADKLVVSSIHFGRPNNDDTLDTVIQRLDLSNEQYEADGLLSTIFQRGTSWIARRMTWSRVAAYVAVSMTTDFIAYLANRLAPYNKLSNVLANGNWASANIILTGNNHFITKQLPGEPASDRGHYHIVQDADGKETIASWAGHTADGGRAIDVQGVRAFLATALRITLGVGRLEASNTTGWFRRLGIKALPIATKKAPVLVADWNTDELGHDVKQRSLRDFGNDLAEEIDPIVWSNVLGPYLSGTGSGGGTNSNVFAVGVIFCHPVTVTVDEPTALSSKPFRITPDMVGQSQLHNLNRPGDYLFPVLLNKFNRPEEILDITFPDANHFQLDYRAAGDSGYEGGKLLLTIIPIS